MASMRAESGLPPIVTGESVVYACGMQWRVGWSHHGDPSTWSETWIYLYDNRGNELVLWSENAQRIIDKAVYQEVMDAVDADIKKGPR